jgi:hypothetical protein
MIASGGDKGSGFPSPGFTPWWWREKAPNVAHPVSACAAILLWTVGHCAGSGIFYLARNSEHFATSEADPPFFELESRHTFFAGK